ncbi:17733_t:CDS:2, partial [Dentiscutata erythropus]
MTTKAEDVLESVLDVKPELDEFMGGVVNVINALSPTIPMLSIIATLINEIFTINEKAQFNKKISESIINRIASVDPTIKFLISRAKCDENFRDLRQQRSFIRFQDSLRKIKVFAEEYEACMRDLSFTMTIVFDEQRRIDNDSSNDILAEMVK